MRIKLDRKSRRLLKAFTLNTRDGEAGDMPRSQYNYGKDVGDGLSSNVIVAVALWIMRNFPEAPVVVRDPNGELDADHPTADLLRNPNPYYSGAAMRGGLSLDYSVQGNAYIEIERNESTRRPTALYYQPSMQIAPVGTGKELITHYIHQSNNGPRRIEVEDIIHFRYGLNPRDTKIGFSPLQSLFREVFTDDEAANYTAAVLRNFGMPGLLVQPKQEGGEIGPKLSDKLKTYFSRMFRGDSRGQALVLNGQVSVDTFEADLSKMNIDKLRQIPEERVTAVMGVPAAVVGFGTGLEQTKVGATMAEMRQMAYESVIIPMQRTFGQELTTRLLPEFDTQEKTAVVFDLREVRVLQEDANARSERAVREWNAGLITRAEGRGRLGEKKRTGDDVYKMGFSDVLLPAGQTSAKARKLPEWVTKAISKNTHAERQELIERFHRDRTHLERIFADELKKIFTKVGDELAAIWEREQVTLAAGNGHRKAVSEEDRKLIDRILLGFTIAQLPYEAAYVRVLKETVNSINVVVGLGVELTEPLEQEIIALGGTRKGLVDMTEQTRQAMYKSVAEARAEGLGVQATANRIRGGIASGPWNSVEVRAEIIARTETAFAQNSSALTAYESAENVSTVEAFDAQRGPTDDRCENRNGQIMTTVEARGELAEEHPNGTLDFAPVVDD